MWSQKWRGFSPKTIIYKIKVLGLKQVSNEWTKITNTKS
jgi:hypothetical protein